MSVVPFSAAIADVEQSPSSTVVDHESREAVVPVAPPRRRMLHLGTVVVLVVGLVITGVLTFGAYSVHQNNEDRLLRQRVRDTAAVITASTPNSIVPLSSAAAFAEATNGNVASFRQLMEPIVGPGRRFVSASLWPTGARNPRPRAVIGVGPELATQPRADVQSYLSRARGKGSLFVYDLLAARDRRLGYAWSAPANRPRYVVYAEAALPKDRRARVDQNSAFADLGYALYLGPTPDQDHLLASSTGGELLHGRLATARVPFGDEQLLLVVTPHKELGGGLLAQLPWVLGGFGLLFTLLAAWLVEGLTRRRAQAENLAYENARLYSDQRSVAQTLQQSLLPGAFPTIEGLDLAARYVAGVEGIDIGGDWYDAVQLDDGRVVVVVGDVSGRGLPAATMMASLRYAIRAYAAEGVSPAELLTKLSSLVSVGRDGHFATVLCGSLDVSAHRLTVANAGHPNPLLVAGPGAEFVTTPVGVPIGVTSPVPYREVTVSVPPGAALLLYTDGLVERRGESLDTGLERLRLAAEGAGGSVDELLTRVVRAAIPQGSGDDTAILGLQWRE